MMQYHYIEGQYDLIPYAKRWALPGTFPRRYWDMVECEEDELAKYLSGQQPFIKKTDNQSFEMTPQASYEHVCARCKKPCKQQYKHCYRCNAYLKTKVRLAKEGN